MSLFVPSSNTQAFLKAGLMGFAGSGKTFTATEIAIGLVKIGRARGLPFAARPVLFLDTETGSDWIQPRLAEQQIALHTAKTRSFTDLKDAIREAEKEGSVLLIDSISHVWRDLCESYKTAKKRARLEFQDWAVLKEKWGEFTDLFVNSQAHIVVCGRAGYEYEHFEDDNGKKQIAKSGVKMKAEGEFGYEPSLLILMERETNPDDLKQVRHVAHVLKDRADRIDGKWFVNPTFDDFEPHVRCLNLGGAQVGVDVSRKSTDEFESESRETDWIKLRQKRDIALDEIKEELVRVWPSRSEKDARAKADFLEEVFGTRSWTAVEAMKVDKILDGRNLIWLRLRGFQYSEKPPSGERVEVPEHAGVDPSKANFPSLPAEL